tara:strand:+ start:243 stop:1508 length:1266 start_codon:yes stop_codon:yes gene_type:complete
MAIKKKSKRKTKQVQSPFNMVEVHELYEGDVLVYRGNRSGKWWQFRTWIAKEKKYIKQTLKTKDLEIAKERAKEKFFDIQNKLRSGGKVFDSHFRELADDYLKYQKSRIQREVGSGSIGITQARFKTIETQVNRHIVPFVGDKTRISELHKDMFKAKYTNYRKKKNPTVRDVTIVNERASVGNLFRWANDNGFIRGDQLPRWEEMAKNADKRDAFDIGEWKEIYNYLRSWTKNSSIKEKIDRDITRYFILVLANTGIRYGEARLLRNRNVSIFQKNKKILARVDIKIGKTGTRDSVIGRRGDLFKKIKTLTKYKKPDDYVFADQGTGEQFKEATLRRLWKELIDNTSLKDKQPRPVFYCLRHTYATFRLYAKVPVFDLAENMGCDVKYIQDHYGHIHREMISERLTKDFKQSDAIDIVMEF